MRHCLRIPLTCAISSLVVLAMLAAGAAATAQPPRPGSLHRFHRDFVLGTSFDLAVRADTPAQAADVEHAILAEIDRLERIVSLYRPDSQASRLSAAPLPCDPEVLELLQAYDLWNARTHSAVSGQLGSLIATWKFAEKIQRLPADSDLARLAREARQAPWRIDRLDCTVVRLASHPLNLDCLGKGFILEKAIAAASARIPAAQAILLDIGGDIRAWRNPRCASLEPWEIGVADPRHPSDNAPPLTILHLDNHAVATSGGYERGYTINGRRYSHILDPRTGRPAQGALSATVIAPGNPAANALATALCILPPSEGLQLVAATPGAECLIIDADGREHRSPGFAALESHRPLLAANLSAAAKPAWPAGFQVTLALTLKQNRHRPYVAVWIEDAGGKPVRTLTVWGNETKYLRKLPNWWRLAQNRPAPLSSITRATRPAGKYTLTWDGLDDRGVGVPLGTYRLCIETNREKGVLAYRKAMLECGAAPAAATLEGAGDFEPVHVTYGPRP